MKRVASLLASLLMAGATVVFGARAALAEQPGAPPSTRGFQICVSQNAPAGGPVQQAAQEVLAAVGTQPLLKAFTQGATNGGAPKALCTSETLSQSARNYSHLVLIGLAPQGLPTDDPLIALAWQREARVENNGAGLYVFGFGHLLGDIGYVESDRNPFLHGETVLYSPFEAEVVTLSGNTPAAVKLAADAFVNQSLINGVVAGPGWTRGAQNLLTRDPLAPGFAAPSILASEVPTGGYALVGLSQASEDEYRGVLADTGIEPSVIWRAKYYLPGAWDPSGVDSSGGYTQPATLAEYANGLHRRAYGNSLWMAQIDAGVNGPDAGPLIATAAGLTRSGTMWVGAQPPYEGGTFADAGPLDVWQSGSWVLMTTLPAAPSWGK